MRTEPGEVWLADLGLAAKTRPVPAGKNLPLIACGLASSAVLIGANLPEGHLEESAVAKFQWPAFSEGCGWLVVGLSFQS
jgi:hypothetical protein